MKRVLIQDKYNKAKSWEIAYISHGYYLREYIHGHQYGRGCRVTLSWLKSLGLFDMQPISITIQKNAR